MVAHRPPGGPGRGALAGRGPAPPTVRARHPSEPHPSSEPHQALEPTHRASPGCQAGVCCVGHAGPTQPGAVAPGSDATRDARAAGTFTAARTQPQRARPAPAHATSLGACEPSPSHVASDVRASLTVRAPLAVQGRPPFEPTHRPSPGCRAGVCCVGHARPTEPGACAPGSGATRDAPAVRRPTAKRRRLLRPTCPPCALAAADVPVGLLPFSNFARSTAHRGPHNETGGGSPAGRRP